VLWFCSENNRRLHNYNPLEVFDLLSNKTPNVIALPHVLGSVLLWKRTCCGLHCQCYFLSLVFKGLFFQQLIGSAAPECTWDPAGPRSSWYGCVPCCCLYCFHFFGVTWLFQATCFHPELCAHYISKHPRRFCMRKLETHAQQRSKFAKGAMRYLSQGRHKQLSDPWAVRGWISDLLMTSVLTLCAHSPGREMQGTSPVVTFNNPSYHSRHTFKDLLPVPQKLKGPIFAALLPFMAPSPLQPTAACSDLPAPSQLRSWRYLNALQDFSRVLRDGDRNMPAWHDGCFISVLLLGSSTEQRVWVTARGGTGQHQCHWTAQLHRSNVVLTQ